MNVRLPDGTVLRNVPEGTSREQLNAKLEANGYDLNKLNQPKEAPEVSSPDPEPVAPPEVRPEYQAFGEVPEEIDADKLIENESWMKASENVYQLLERKPFEGTSEELSDWSREMMADFNYNILLGTARIGNRVTEADQQTKEAFLYMMDTFDNTNISWQGSGNALTSLAQDPTTYAGLASLGLGTVARSAAKASGKELFKMQLKKSLGRTGAVAGTEGAIYTYADNDIRQGIEVDAGRKDEKDLGEAAVATGIGALGGATLGVGLDVLATKVGQIFSKKLNGKPEVNPKDKPEVEPTVNPKDVPAVDPEVEPKVDIEENINKKITGMESIMTARRGLPPGVKDVAGIRIPVMKTQMEAVTNLAEMTQFADDVSKQLQDVNIDDAGQVFQSLHVSEMTTAELSYFKRSTQMAAGALDDELTELVNKNLKNPTPTTQAKIDDLSEKHNLLVKLDAGLAYNSGLDLRARREGKTEFVTFDKLRQEGIKEEDIPAIFVERQSAIRKTREYKKRESAYDVEIDKLMKAGDLKGALKKLAEKNKELDNLSALGWGEASWGNKLMEFSIGNVFTVTTLQINGVASAAMTAVIPAVRALLNDPLKLSTRKEVAASYVAMKQSLGGSMRAARAAWKFEQALLTRDPERFLESGLSIKGTKGGLMRFFIRFTNATDEFLSHLNYNGYIAGKAAADATESGMAQGLKGDELTEYVRAATKDALEAAWKQASAEELVMPIVNKGKNLGLTGDKLAKYIEQEVVKDPEALKAGANEEALNYVRDVLFKRDFSGKGAVSEGVRVAERFLNNNPVMKWMTGQLFFRTPIRVFESGIRMTPVAQYIAPGFLKDLRGDNGVERQLRAKGESLAAFSIATAVATLYAEGRITGAGAYEDWRQESLVRDSHLADAYTIKGEDGGTWSYRFFDPIATPIKTLVTTFEELDKLAIRKAQGEEIDESVFEEVGSVAIAGVIALAKAIRDANLAQGLASASDVWEAFQNPEDNTSGFVQFAGDRLRTLVPNTLRKLDRYDHQEQKAPADLLQMIETQTLDPLRYLGVDAPILTSKAYDHMGRVKTMTDVGTLHNIFSVATVDEREKGRSEDEKFIDQEIIRLQEETGIVLRVPFTHSSTASLDFRTIKASTGNETLFDKWNRYYNDQIPVEALAEVLRSPLPDGTFKHRAARVQTVTGLLNDARDRAFKMMLAEEDKLITEMRKQIYDKAQAEAGLWDADRTTKAPTAPWDN